MRFKFRGARDKLVNDKATLGGFKGNRIVFFDQPFFKLIVNTTFFHATIGFQNFKSFCPFIIEPLNGNAFWYKIKEANFLQEMF